MDLFAAKVYVGRTVRVWSFVTQGDAWSFRIARIDAL